MAAKTAQCLTDEKFEHIPMHDSLDLVSKDLVWSLILKKFLNVKVTK